jgi:phospholipid-binding lipoprotein MlaA
MKHICRFILTIMLVSYPAVLWAQAFDESDTAVHTSQEPALSDAGLAGLPQPSSLSDITVQSEATTIVVAQRTMGEEIPSRELASSVGKEAPAEGEEEVPVIADPLAPINKAMYHVNDKLYFWLLKPVTQVYSHTVPEPFRVVFSNAFDNLWAPSRIVNNLLQLRFKAAGNEFIRFIFNSIAGIGGLGDVATPALGIKKQEADFGQTLGHYGAGHCFYLVLPLFGPSSLRDGVGLAADRFMYPLSYISSSNLTFGEAAGIFAGEKVNDASFHIGEYESFKESAIDPYVAMRDAFVQYRQKKVEDSKKPSE